MHDIARQLCRKTLNVRRLLAVICLGVSAGTACGRAAPSPSSPSSPSVATALNISRNLSFCVDEVNRYRASVGRAPLARSADLEAFAAEAAQSDGLAHQAHQFFATTNGGGLSRAENEILWWEGLAVPSVIQQGLKQMWEIGPAGEHYDIMTGAFSQIGCGIFVNGSEVTVAQDFR
jgi:Cysteine-rich secretory protein family